MQTYQIVRTSTARTDLKALLTYYTQETSEEFSKEIFFRIWKQVGLLKNFPEGTRTGRVKETRELVIQGLPYFVSIIIKEDIIFILNIIHTRRKYP